MLFFVLKMLCTLPRGSIQKNIWFEKFFYFETVVNPSRATLIVEIDRDLKDIDQLLFVRKFL